MPDTPPSSAASHPPASFFVAVDSDGCAFDTMDLKHKECFIPLFIQHFGLAGVARAAREAAEFVNLRSLDRGVNRFPGYLRVLDLLGDHPSARALGPRLPRMDGLRDWIARGSALSNEALSAEIDRGGDPDLARALAWSEDVNGRIAATVRDVSPFPFVRESLEALRGVAEVMVVSATPGEALRREWAEHGLDALVSSIAGQEAGSKAHVLSSRVRGRFDPARCLMIGDAPGDLRAAEAAGIPFYPIDPGEEPASWRRFHDEALPRFLAGSYAGRYMQTGSRTSSASSQTSPPGGEGPGSPRRIDALRWRDRREERRASSGRNAMATAHNSKVQEQPWLKRQPPWPRRFAYRDLAIVPADGHASPLAKPDARVAVADLLP